MFRREVLFSLTLVLLGVFDWVTTIIGVVFFGAKELNPLFAGLTESNMVLFSMLKLSAVLLAGSAFYKAGTLSRSAGQVLSLETTCLNTGYAVSFLVLSTLVINNLIVLIRLL